MAELILDLEKVLASPTVTGVNSDRASDSGRFR